MGDGSDSGCGAPMMSLAVFSPQRLDRPALSLAVRYCASPCTCPVSLQRFIRAPLGVHVLVLDLSSPWTEGLEVGSGSLLNSSADVDCPRLLGQSWDSKTCAGQIEHAISDYS